MGKRLVLAGYFGRGNLGDDAILLGFTNGIKDLNYDITAIAGNPATVSREYGIPGIGHLDLKAIQEAIENSDALVFPGGSIFQDVTSVRSVAYYANLIKIAKKAGKKVVMLGQGVGPLDRFMGKRLALGALQAADIIAVRDRDSVQTLKDLGVNGVSRVTADMAFLLPEPEREEGQRQFGVGDMKSVGISARPAGKDKNKAVINLFSELLYKLFENGWVPSMIEMDRELDRPLLDKIGKVHGGKVPEIRGLTHPRDLQRRLQRMDAIIGMRLHAGILGATVGVPAYMVSYDPKIRSFSNMMGFSAPPSIERITADSLFSGFQTFYRDKEKLIVSVSKKRDELALQAQANIEVLVSTVGQ